MTIGEQLRQMRNQAGHSVAEAARIAEVSERTWRRWEVGNPDPPPGAIKLYLQSIGVAFRREDWE